MERREVDVKAKISFYGQIFDVNFTIKVAENITDFENNFEAGGIVGDYVYEHISENWWIVEAQFRDKELEKAKLACNLYFKKD